MRRGSASSRVRQALGAGRGELLRQLLTESLILVSAGGALAWGFAEMATRLLGRWAQIESSLAPDRTVLLFTLGVLALAGLLFGLAPLRVALAGRAELAHQDFGGDIACGCGQIAHGQDHCRAADGAVRGAAGGRGTADSYAAQSGKYSAWNAGRRPGGLRSEARHYRRFPQGRIFYREPADQSASVCPAWNR